MESCIMEPMDVMPQVTNVLNNFLTLLFLHFSLNINLLTLMLALFVEHFKPIAYFT